MTSLINENQPQSLACYVRTIRSHSNCTADFVTAQMERIERKYYAGEPVDMAISEFNLMHEMQRTMVKPVKPYSIAKAVFRDGKRIK